MSRFFGGLALGLLVGGGVASGVFWMLMQEEKRRHQEDLAVAAANLKGGIDAVNQFLPVKIGGNGGVPKVVHEKEGKTADIDPEKKVLDLAKSYIADLEKYRFLRVYRATSVSFQMKYERDKFEEMVGKHKDLHSLAGENSIYRETRINKKAGDKAYEFYFTDAESNSFGRKLLNIAMVFIEENGDLRIDDLEISSSMK